MVASWVAFLKIIFLVGGQTVKNPWPIIGGVATAVREEGTFLRPIAAVPGDVLVLTKPLGLDSYSVCKHILSGDRGS